MEKYYYYTYQRGKTTSHAVCCTDNGRFNILERLKFVQGDSLEFCIITFYKEISSEEYEDMINYFNETNEEN